VRNNKGYSEHTFWRELLYLLSFCCSAVLCHGGSILRRLLLARVGKRCVIDAPVAVRTITVIFLVAARRLVGHGEGIRGLAFGPERPQVILPRMQQADRLPLSHAVIDLVRVDGHAAHREGRPPRVAHELRDADECADGCVRWRLHDCARASK
jgi:hypothetical protein